MKIQVSAVPRPLPKSKRWYLPSRLYNMTYSFWPNNGEVRDVSTIIYNEASPNVLRFIPISRSDCRRTDLLRLIRRNISSSVQNGAYDPTISQRCPTTHAAFFNVVLYRTTVPDLWNSSGNCNSYFNQRQHIRIRLAAAINSSEWQVPCPEWSNVAFSCFALKFCAVFNSLHASSSPKGD